MNMDWICNPNRVGAKYLRLDWGNFQFESKHVTDENCNNCRLGTLRQIQLHLATYGLSRNDTMNSSWRTREKCF